MATNLLYILNMKYRIAKHDDLKISATPGRPSILSSLRADLFKLKANTPILIETETPELQKLVHRKMRHNIQHWKKRNGLKHISVHYTDEGNVALTYEPNKLKRGAEHAKEKRKGARAV